MANAIANFRTDTKWLYWVGGLFAVINAILISFEFFYAPLLPVALAILLLAFFSLDKLVLFIVFLTPLSVNLTDIGLGVGLTLPTDPLLFGVMIVFLLKLFAQGKFSKKVADHPITLAIMINLAWLTITTITSEMPLISLKFFISRLWYVITFYFIATQIFKNFDRIKLFLGLYLVAFSGVIIYTIIHHGIFGFSEQAAHWVMSPFFNDHTSYGAILAMFYPLIIGLVFSNTYSKSWRVLFVGVFILFTVALILSYTRAAWVSLIGALGIYIIMRLRIRFSTVFMLAGASVIALLLSWDTIVMKLEKNRQDSSAELTEHVQSISNISTDASNLERLNRWSAAWRMFKERPFVGWGPGTYMFQYAPFQHSSEKTSISTNAGNKGNAHSEYIGPLAESGVFGMLSFLMVVFCILYYGVKLYPRIKNREHRLIMMSLFLGIITYLIHALLNNFLDTDKASAPFWGFVAVLVAIDVFHTESSENRKKELSEANRKDSTKI
ncbi:MAG: O-antigen ligase family protein [Flavobacteriales bacterium]|nr:O-antigen ligase family protein [Flavobacteriales bacterium]